MRGFFSRGFIQDSIPKSEADALLEIISKESFREGGKYKEDPSLDPPQVMTNASQGLIEVCKQWSNYSILKDMRLIFGDFSYWFCTANRFNGGRGMMWHNDHIDATFATVLIYLTKEDWVENYGGCLEIGKVDDASRMVDPRLNKSESGIVHPSGKVVPKHGTTVILNNMSLPFCHRVTPTAHGKTRYTLMFHFGYWENTNESRKNFGFSEVAGRLLVEGS